MLYDNVVLKIRHNQRVINKSMYLALGVDIEGHKQLLGMWLAETEGAKFWLSVRTALKNRGFKEMDDADTELEASVESVY